MLIYLLFQVLMNNGPVAFLIVLILLTLPLLISVTIHEWAHGITAYKFGDPTPKIQGRLSFNPFAHLDPVGTIMLFVVGIGWAKPVQINPENINGRTKQMLVALAGPASNFILALTFAFIVLIVANLVFPSGIYGVSEAATPKEGFIGLIIILLRRLVEINIVLALFNMIPLPPLDGSNVIRWLLPDNLAEMYFRLAPFGFIILMLMLFTVGFGFIYQAAVKIEMIIFQIIEPIVKAVLPG